MSSGAKYRVLTARPSRKKCLIVSIIGLILLVIIIIVVVVATRDKDGRDKKKHPDKKKFVAEKYNNAAVAADAKTCSLIGVDILKKNGSAADSAIASLFCLGVVNLQSCGIGGGGFMLLYKKSEKKVYVYDYREQAPGASNETMYVNRTRLSKYGGLAVAVPGQVKGLAHVHKLHGSLPWSELVEPSIKLANEGVVVSKPVANYIKKFKGKKDEIPTEIIDLLTDDNGKFLEEGDLLKNPMLAKTLQNIQKHKSVDFYEGKLAEKIVTDIQNTSGIITLDDLKNYKVEEREPLTFTLPDGNILNTMSAPGGGPIIAMIHNIMTGYNLSNYDLTKLDDQVDFYQKLVESMKFSYAQRGLLGDPKFLPKEDIKKVLDLMTNPSTGEKIRKNKITMDKTHDNVSYYGGYWGKDDFGTSHLSLLAENGDAVAATATINTGFGSLVRSAVTGIIYNNEMDDFSTPGVNNFFNYPPTKPNFIKPGKRPLSSMSPTIVLDKNGDVKMIAGASGGSRIISGTAQVILKKLFVGIELGESVAGYRLHHQGVPNQIYVNSNHPAPKDLLDRLKKIGHKVVETTSMSVVQAIYKDGDDIYAMSDPRKHGKADGY